MYQWCILCVSTVVNDVKSSKIKYKKSKPVCIPWIFDLNLIIYEMIHCGENLCNCMAFYEKLLKCLIVTSSLIKRKLEV